MQHPFTLRLDSDTYRKLDELAKLSFRSKGAVIRLLINFASNNPNLVLTDACLAAGSGSISSSPTINDDKEEVQP